MIYVKDLDVTDTGMPYPVSSFPKTFYNQSTRRFSCDLKAGNAAIETDEFPTHSVADAFFGFYERMDPATQSRIRREAADPSKRARYDGNKINWFPADEQLTSTYSFWGSDGSFDGLVKKRQQESTRTAAIAAERKRKTEGALKFLIQFMGAAGSYIRDSHCTSAKAEGRTPPWWCEE